MSLKENENVLESARENISIETIVKVGDEVIERSENLSFATAEEQLEKMERRFENNIINKYGR